MTSNTIHLQLLLLLVTAERMSAFVSPTRPAPISIGRHGQRCRYAFSAERRRGFRFRQESRLHTAMDGDGNGDENGDENGDDPKTRVSEFFFDMSNTNIDPRSSMDAGIHNMLGGAGSGATLGGRSDHRGSGAIASGSGDGFPKTTKTDDTVVMVMDWECLLDALPYHIELGIHAARTTWPHLNDLCNFDTDREWLENKLSAMSHVLASPDSRDKSRHVACEFALATRLILEEQALDRNESTGKNGRYARKFHPRSEINGSNEFEEESRSRRPLTAGELAVNWREFIRSTLSVRYSIVRESKTEGKSSRQEPMEALERAIEEYLSGKTADMKTNSEGYSAKPGIAKSLPLFPQTKFAVRNSATKIVVRISHKFDNDIVARSLNKQLQLLPHERIAKTYKPENAIRRLFLNKDKNIVLLLRPDYKYEFFNENNTSYSSQEVLGSNSNGNININGNSNNNNNNNNNNDDNNGTSNEENCLKDIMKFTHQCDNSQSTRQQQEQQSEEEGPAMPSVVWVDSSWHRLQGLAPIFGDAMPGGKNGKRNTARCSFPREAGDSDNQQDETTETTQNVWLSLWLAEWPAKDTPGSSNAKKRFAPSSENHETAMVYPWTDSLSWDDAEDILIPTTWGSSDTAFQ